MIKLFIPVAGVAYILMDEGDVADIHVLQAAILHDTVEDTDTTIDEIQDVFGEKVRNSCWSCGTLSRLNCITSGA